MKAELFFNFIIIIFMPVLEIVCRKTEVLNTITVVLAKHDLIFSKTSFKRWQETTVFNYKKYIVYKIKYKLSSLLSLKNQIDQLSQNLTLKLHKTSRQFTAPTTANNYSTILY